MKTSTGSLVQSCCVVMATCLGVCQKLQQRRLQQESNQPFSSLSHTCWIQRRRRRVSSMNTGGRYPSHRWHMTHTRKPRLHLKVGLHLSAVCLHAGIFLIYFSVHIFEHLDHLTEEKSHLLLYYFCCIFFMFCFFMY